jgi:hypothetical protein
MHILLACIYAYILKMEATGSFEMFVSIGIRQHGVITKKICSVIPSLRDSAEISQVFCNLKLEEGDLTVRQTT